jgi:tRNA dimethylallyltransferase
VQLIALAGPTATGKSELALLLAEKLGGEIVSVDSMQVYRGLDIGTAKPSTEQRARVPHHLIDVADLSESFDAARFVTLAKEAVGQIQQRGRLAILCGGTGLYFQAFFEGLGEAPPSDPALREQLEKTPLEVLLRELSERDPATFERIDRQNPRRVIRAVEVIRLTGKPFSGQKAPWAGEPLPNAACPLVVLTREPGDLRARITQRVDAMFRNGLVAETAGLIERGLPLNRTASQALGYRQVIEHLRGDRSLSETIELVKIKTRQFAKRQMTWFRKYGRARFVAIKAGDSIQEILPMIEAARNYSRPG